MSFVILCGASVLVPANAVALEEKFRFHCPHCEARVLGRRGSAGKKSQCPSCGKAYTVPEPPSDSDILESHSDRRIHLDTDDLAARIGLPFPVGRLEPRVSPRPQPRYLHPPEEVAAAREEPLPWPLPPEVMPPPAELEPTIEQLAPAPASSAIAQVPHTPERAAGGLAETIARPAHGPDHGPEPADAWWAQRVRPEPSSFLAPTAASIPQFDPWRRRPSPGVWCELARRRTAVVVAIRWKAHPDGLSADSSWAMSAEIATSRTGQPMLLSRHHCQVFKRDEYAVRVRDLGSNSGTYVSL